MSNFIFRHLVSGIMATDTTPSKELPTAAEKRYRSFLGGEGFSNSDLERLIDRYRKNQVETFDKQSADKSDSISQSDILQTLRSLPSIHETLDIPRPQVEGIYNLGYQNYNQGRYEKSIHYFRLAYILDPLNEKYLFSLGLSLEKDRQFFEAASAYLLWSQLQPTSPLGDFRAAVCFIEMGDKRAAESIFQSAANKCGDEKRFEPVLQRTRLYLEGLTSSTLEKET